MQTGKFLLKAAKDTFKTTEFLKMAKVEVPKTGTLADLTALIDQRARDKVMQVAAMM